MKLPQKLACGVGALLLGACATPAPAPQVFPRLITQPYYESVVATWAVEFAGTLETPLPFDVEAQTRSEAVRQIEAGEAALLLTSGQPPESWFTTPLVPLAIAVVTHPENPLRDIRLDELRDLLAGRVSNWSEVGGGDLEVQPSLPLPGEPLGDYLRAAVLGELRPWPGTFLVPTPADVIELVQQDRGAFGFVPAQVVDERVHVLRVEGQSPQAPPDRYPLVVELLATSPDEPVGPLRDFLAWIQAAPPP